MAVTISNSAVAGATYYNTNLSQDCRPVRIMTGPDGNLYFTEQASSAGKIGRITTNGVITEAPVADGTTQPLDITTGPDGAIWFTQATTNALGRIDPANFTNVVEYTLPTNNSGGAIGDQLNGIVLGKDGNLYYCDPRPRHSRTGRCQRDEPDRHPVLHAHDQCPAVARGDGARQQHLVH